MSTLRQQHDNLESATAQRFSELLEKLDIDIVFADDDDDNDEFSDCDIVDIYFDGSETVRGVYVTGINKDGLVIGRETEDGTRGEHNFWNLASLLDKINLVEILEASIKIRT